MIFVTTGNNVVMQLLHTHTGTASAARAALAPPPPMQVCTMMPALLGCTLA
jgi:hypothetical protein